MLSAAPSSSALNLDGLFAPIPVTTPAPVMMPSPVMMAPPPTIVPISVVAPVVPEPTIFTVPGPTFTVPEPTIFTVPGPTFTVPEPTISVPELSPQPITVPPVAILSPPLQFVAPMIPGEVPISVEPTFFEQPTIETDFPSQVVTPFDPRPIVPHHSYTVNGYGLVLSDKDESRMQIVICMLVIFFTILFVWIVWKLLRRLYASKIRSDDINNMSGTSSGGDNIPINSPSNNTPITTSMTMAIDASDIQTEELCHPDSGIWDGSISRCRCRPGFYGPSCTYQRHSTQTFCVANSSKSFTMDMTPTAGGAQLYVNGDGYADPQSCLALCDQDPQCLGVSHDGQRCRLVTSPMRVTSRDAPVYDPLQRCTLFAYSTDSIIAPDKIYLYSGTRPYRYWTEPTDPNFVTLPLNHTATLNFTPTHITNKGAHTGAWSTRPLGDSSFSCEDESVYIHHSTGADVEVLQLPRSFRGRQLWVRYQ